MYPLQYLGGKGRVCNRHFSLKVNRVFTLWMTWWCLPTFASKPTIWIDSLVAALWIFLPYRCTNKAWQSPWQAYNHQAWRPSNQQPNNHVTLQHLRQPQVFTMEYEAAIKESWLHFWRWRARLCTEVSDIRLTKPGCSGSKGRSGRSWMLPGSFPNVVMVGGKLKNELQWMVKWVGSTVLFLWYCWWFRNPANKLRLVVYPNTYEGSIYIYSPTS